jgi:WS/DGAT/MGAT family acyltransferase
VASVPIDRLNAEDRLMLEADELWPQDVGALVTLDGAGLLDAAGEFRIGVVRAAITVRLHLVPRFRQIIHVPRRGQGGPLWLDSAHFDLAEHVRVAPLPPSATESDLLHATEQLRRRRLDRSRPMWEMWFLPGLADGHVGLFVRFHHAIADGRAALTMLAAFLDIVPDTSPAPAPSWVPATLPPARALLIDNVRRRFRGLAGGLSVLTRPRSAARQLRAGVSEARELVGEGPAPKTSLDRLVGPERTFALVRTTIEQVKAIGHAHGATTNDVLLALIAGGLRALLLSRGERVDGLTVRIYVPVSLRHAIHGTVQGNLISQMVVHLPLGEPDPGRRLERISTEAAKLKQKRRPSMGAMFRIPFLRRRLIRFIGRQRVNSTGTTVHGPRRPLYLCGARVFEIFPLINLFGNETLGVGALTYAGAFNIGIAGDRATFPDMDAFVAGIRAELGALGGQDRQETDPGAAEVREPSLVSA